MVISEGRHIDDSLVVQTLFLVGAFGAWNAIF